MVELLVLPNVALPLQDEPPFALLSDELPELLRLELPLLLRVELPEALLPVIEPEVLEVVCVGVELEPLVAPEVVLEVELAD